MDVSKSLSCGPIQLVKQTAIAGGNTIPIEIPHDMRPAAARLLPP
jgi:hypothetical protein